MKKIHLIANAHLDPVWQWEWEEGAAEALSTFRIAADFCDKYDNFIFCHNEALLYKWIEEYDTPLFKKIQRLVKEGKWHIMGGWHLQPDCNMPSGEFFVRQILYGRKYFLEKFGVVPKVAINVDPFGHTRGLVQILKKTGYDGYMFMRPDANAVGNPIMNLPSNEFKWIGYDDSEIIAIRHGSYNSAKGYALEKVKSAFNDCAENDISLCLWGVGNHGGGPSKKDIDDINEFANAIKKTDGHEILHSTPERYVDELKKQKKSLPRYDKSLNPCDVGCYTSQIRVKQKYRAAENMYVFVESISSHAALNGLMKYPDKELSEALYDILTVQFHDILPGSAIQPAEEMAIRMLDHATEILSRVRARAFFALSLGQKKADEDKIPILVYNPYPYEINADLVSEFMLWDQNWNNEFLQPKIYTENGNIIPAQCEKENSTIPIEWRKRVVFNATLAPMSLNRFDCCFDTLEKKPIPICNESETHYLFNNETLYVKINKQTGLIDSYRKNGKEYLKKNAIRLDVYKDDYDPWGMNVTSFKEKVGEFKLATPKIAREFCCLDKEISPVHIIESGKIRTVIEAVFYYKNSRALIKYFLSEKDDLKIDVHIVWTEKQKMIKLAIPTCFNAKTCIGEHAYGNEELYNDLTENISQRYLIGNNKTFAFAVANNGIYGSSFDVNTGMLNLTLLRSPSYTAHPLGERITMPQDRFMPYIDQGERDFSFSFDAGENDNILDSFPLKAQLFNMQPMTLSLYPSAQGTLPVSPLKIDNKVILLSAFKKAETGNGYIIRLFNPTENKQSTKLEFMDKSINLEFSKFEIKTIRADDAIVETDLLEDIIHN